MTVDPEKILQAVTGKTKILILTSPNNPLSTIINRERLTHVLDNISTDILVLLDEAYVDYSDEGSRTALLSRYTNLMVLRTFSKIYGLAGLRVGYALAHEFIIQALMKAKPTWNMGSLAAAGALAALQDREHYEKTRTVVQKGRAYLLERLTGFSNIAVIMEPQANFLCLQILDPSTTSRQLFERLLERGVIVKDCSVSYKGLGNRFLRVDVNTQSRMDIFLDRLREVLP